MAVTPVRAGPWPMRSGPSPWITVVWPTRTPGTSVSAFHSPVGIVPTAMPRSRRRGCRCVISYSFAARGASLVDPDFLEPVEGEALDGEARDVALPRGGSLRVSDED